MLSPTVKTGASLSMKSIVFKDLDGSADGHHKAVEVAEVETDHNLFLASGETATQIVLVVVLILLTFA